MQYNKYLWCSVVLFGILGSLFSYASKSSPRQKHDPVSENFEIVLSILETDTISEQVEKYLKYRSSERLDELKKFFTDRKISFDSKPLPFYFEGETIRFGDEIIENISSSSFKLRGELFKLDSKSTLFSTLLEIDNRLNSPKKKTNENSKKTSKVSLFILPALFESAGAYIAPGYAAGFWGGVTSFVGSKILLPAVAIAGTAYLGKVGYNYATNGKAFCDKEKLPNVASEKGTPPLKGVVRIQVARGAQWSQGYVNIGSRFRSLQDPDWNVRPCCKGMVFEKYVGYCPCNPGESLDAQQSCYERAWKDSVKYFKERSEGAGRVNDTGNERYFRKLSGEENLPDEGDR